jgi:hypothetical protein
MKFVINTRRRIGFEFHENGNIKSGFVEPSTFVTFKGYSFEQFVEFYEDGSLKSGTLALSWYQSNPKFETTEGKWKTFKTGDRIVFDKTGKVTE